jgi:two-component system, NarL family, nitrate/nitrite response regulator NarL
MHAQTLNPRSNVGSDLSVCCLAMGEVEPAQRLVKVLLVDDHPVVRKGVGFSLARQPGLKVVGEAGDGKDALEKVRRLLPDIVLMDIDLPGMDGLTVTDLLHRELPQIKVLLFSMHENTALLDRVLQCGARGYVLKEAPVSELVKAIETVQAGGTFFSSSIACAVLNKVARGGSSEVQDPLTHREREVLVHIAEGMSNKEIANHLGVGVRTVETHRERVMHKLKIHTVAGLTKYSLTKGLITLPDEMEA